MQVKDKKLVQNRYRTLPQRASAAGRLRLVGVSYLNAQPLLHGLLQGLGEERTQLELATPADLSRKLLEDEADAGLAPVAVLATHGGLELVPGMAIGCDGAVRSVKIVGDVPLEEMDEVLLDASSRTSVVLARILIKQRCGGREPRYHSQPPHEIIAQVSGKTGGLLIGDPALEVEGRFAYELDLGQAWTELTGLPFVFAVWVARPGVLSARDVLLLQGSLEAGLAERGKIAQAWARTRGGAAERHLAYMTNSIEYALDERALLGLREFLRRAAELKLLPPTDLQFVSDVEGRPNTKNAARSIDDLLEHAASGGRLSFDDAMRLGQHAPLHDLGLAADARRKQLHPDEVVTYIVDRNINYTNVCTTSCRFCAFYRPVGHAEGYVLTREQLAEKIDETVAAGGIQILLQGGLNPALHLEWYEDLFRWMKASFPIKLHALSPEEIWHLVRIEDLSVEDVLKRLRDAGMDSLPGGGAEVLTDRVRSKIAKAKCTSAEWIEVMRVAHRVGMRTTATMMFGTADTLEDRVLHMLKVRDLQDETGGFTAFICLGLPARPRHASGRGRDRYRAVPAHPGAEPARARQRAQHPDLVGHARPRHRPARLALRRQRHGQHDVRRERGLVCGHDLRDGRSPDRTPRAREWVHGCAAQHALRAADRAVVSALRGIAGSWVITGDAGAAPIADGGVVLDANERVVAVGEGAALRASHPSARWESPRAVLMPGLVNAHTHLELSALRGQVPGGHGFAAWVGGLVPARERVAPEQDSEAIDLGVSELLAAGTAAVGEVSNTLAAVPALTSAMLLGCVFHEVYGMRRDSGEAMLRMAEQQRGELDRVACPSALRARAAYRIHDAPRRLARGRAPRAQAGRSHLATPVRARGRTRVPARRKRTVCGVPARARRERARLATARYRLGQLRRRTRAAWAGRDRACT